MDNLSNIGFTFFSEEDLIGLIEKAHPYSVEKKVPEGAYHLYADASGAEMWIESDNEKTCIGASPHYNGKSRRTVCLTKSIGRSYSELDGALHCWASPAEEGNPESGLYPFLFDVPDFRMLSPFDFPLNTEIQLTAFAESMELFDTEVDFQNSQGETKFATQSFIPIGLFNAVEGAPEETPATAFFCGIIKEFELKQNALTGERFYWFLVDTLGGPVDVVAGMHLMEKEPVLNGIIKGEFTLSGKLMDAG